MLLKFSYFTEIPRFEEIYSHNLTFGSTSFFGFGHIIVKFKLYDHLLIEGNNSP